MDFLSKIYSNTLQEIIQYCHVMTPRWPHDRTILNDQKVSHDDHELLLRAERQIATITEKVDRMVGEAQGGFSFFVRHCPSTDKR